MITFNQKTKVFTLDNGSITYSFLLNEEGFLETLYYGPHLNEELSKESLRGGDIDNCSTEYFDTDSNKEKTFPDHFKSTTASLEIATHGYLDKRGAPIIIQNPTGSYQTSFIFSSYQIFDGIKELKDLPGIRTKKKDCETLEITLQEQEAPVKLVYSLTIFTGFDVISKSFQIINEGEASLHLLRAFSLELDLLSSSYTLNHFDGVWANERNWNRNPVVQGEQRISSNYGRSSHEENPFVFLSSTDASMTTGEVIGFNLIYSGNFTFRTFSDYSKSLRILYGLNDEDFDYQLAPRQKFETPIALMFYSSCGVDGLSVVCQQFIKKHIINQQIDHNYKPIIFNSWEGCLFDFNTDKIISYIKDSEKIGSELFVLDDGWFGRRNDDYDGLGDWHVNSSKIDLHRVIDYCHQEKLKFGIWFEPEMVNPNSDLFKKHPEYVLGYNHKAMTISRHQLVLDFSNPEVVDCIYQQMVLFLDEYPVDYIKWDHNRSIGEHYSSYYHFSQQGEIYHRLVLGYYSLLSRLTKRYPQILFEGCASGGARFDLGTLYYCPQIWASDESDPLQRISIQYNTSLGYPLSTIGSHVNNNPLTSYKTKAMIAFFGTYGYEMNPNNLKTSEVEELSEIKELYHQYHQSVVEDGVVYHLMNPNISDFVALESVSSNQESALLLLMNKLKDHDHYYSLKLLGLKDEYQYQNDLDNQVHSGQYYRLVGLRFSRSWFNEFNCRIIKIIKKK